MSERDGDYEVGYGKPPAGRYCGCPPARKTGVDRYSRARLAPNGPRINWTVVAENWKVKTATL